MRSSSIGKIALTLISLLLTGWFILDPDPLPMALFVFVAHPLFLTGAILYVREVLLDLKRHGVF